MCSRSWKLKCIFVEQLYTCETKRAYKTSQINISYLRASQITPFKCFFDSVTLKEKPKHSKTTTVILTRLDLLQFDVNSPLYTSKSFTLRLFANQKHVPRMRKGIKQLFRYKEIKKTLWSPAQTTGISLSILDEHLPLTACKQQYFLAQYSCTSINSRQKLSCWFWNVFLSIFAFFFTLWCHYVYNCGNIMESQIIFNPNFCPEY